MKWTVSFERNRSGRGVVEIQAPSGNTADMSLQKNTPGQNITFGIVNASTGAAMTGLGSSVPVFITIDGGSQASGSQTVNETANGQYNYPPSQAETNGNMLGFLIAAPGAIVMNLMFLTAGGIHRNQPGQTVTFAMSSEAGVPDPGASPSVFITKDGSQAAGAGTITNLGNAQFRYALTQAETNCQNLAVIATAPGDVIQNINMYTIP